MKSNSRIFFVASVLTSLGALAGCKSNPLPEGDRYTTEKPQEQRQVLPPFSMIVPTVLEFEEGKESQYTIEAWVPEPGSPKLTLTGFPAGVEIGADGKTIVWTPDFDAATDAANPTSMVKSYVGTIVLSSTTQPESSVSQTVILQVKNTPQETKVSASDVSVTELDNFSADITVASVDFPTGPFEIYQEGLPPGAEFVRDAVNPAIYHVRFVPDTRAVTTRDVPDANGYYKQTKVKFTVLQPDGRTFQKEVTWTLRDKRQPPQISGPALVEGREVHFVVRAEDLNGEIAPEVKIIPETAPYGKISYETIMKTSHKNAARNPSKMVQVHWTEIPADRVGTTDELRLQFCVNRRASDVSLCDTHAVQVKFSESSRGAPALSRTAWPFGQIRYVKNGQQLRFAMPVSDTATAELPDVTVEPMSMRSQVSWVNGELVVNPTSTGPKAFTLVVTSALGKSVVETFSFEALPASWSDTVIVSGAPTSKEAVALLTAFPGAEFMPAYQSLDERAMALRQTLIVGTETVHSGTSALAEIEKASAQVKNVVYATPLLQMLPAGVKTEFANVGLNFVGRIDQLTNPPALSSLNVEAETTSGLTRSTAPIQFLGTTTTESMTPLVLAPSTTGACQTVISMQEQQSAGRRHSAAVVCDRANGGRLIASGFEWADLNATNASETNLPMEWLRKLVNP